MPARTKGVRYRVELTGLAPILDRVRELKDSTKQLPLMKKAIRAAGAYLLSEMRKRLKKHDRTGHLRKSMKSKLKFYKKSGTLVLVLGVASNMRKSVMLEKRLGKARKTVAANIVSHNYAHLVFGNRQSFTQTITYTTRRGRVVTMRRRIAGYTGENVIEQVVSMHGDGARKRMLETIQKGLGL